MVSTKIFPAFWLLFIPVMGAMAAPSTKEDSGLVSLFNGRNLEGFHTYFQTKGVVDIGTQDAFLVEGGMVHVPKRMTASSPNWKAISSCRKNIPGTGCGWTTGSARTRSHRIRAW